MSFLDRITISANVPLAAAVCPSIPVDIGDMKQGIPPPPSVERQRTVTPPVRGPMLRRPGGTRAPTPVADLEERKVAKVPEGEDERMPIGVFTIGADVSYKRRSAFKPILGKCSEFVPAEDPEVVALQGAGDAPVVPVETTPPPATPPVIENKILTRFENQGREKVWFTFSKAEKDNTVISITDGEHDPHVIGRHFDPKNWCDTIAANAARRADLPPWCHNASCIIRADDSGDCCFQKPKPVIVDPMAPERYTPDLEIGTFHYAKKSYMLSKQGVVLDAKTKHTVPAKEAGEVKMAWDLEVAAQAAIQIPQEAAQAIEHAARPPSPREPRVRSPDPQVVEQLVADICPICREPMEHQQALARNPCSHQFHLRCQEQAMQAGMRRCPMCRAELPGAGIPHDPWMPEPIADWPIDEIPPADPEPMDVRMGVPEVPAAVVPPAAPVQVVAAPQQGEPDLPGQAGPLPPPPPVNPAVIAPRVIRLSYWVSPNTVVRARHSGLYLQPGDRSRPHPMMAVAKLVMLKNIHDILGDTGYYVGGKVSAIVERGFNFHCNLAYSRPCDQAEFNQYRNVSCMCMRDCVHTRAPGDRPRVPFTVMRPEVTLATLHRLAENCGADHFYVADLNIESARGLICPPDHPEADMRAINRHQEVEGHYMVNAAGAVTVQINADRHAFSYPYPSYQSAKTVQIPGTEQWYAVRNVLEHDRHVLYKFTQVVRPDEPEEPRPDLATCLRNVDYIGPVAWNPDGDFKAPSNEVKQLDIRCAYSFKNDLIFGKEDANGIFLPKNVLASAATDLAYLERNVQTMHATKTRIKTALEPYHLSAVDKHNAVLLGVPLALSLSVQDEVSMWDTHVAPVRHALDTIKARVNFQMPSLSQLLTGPLSSDLSIGTSRRVAKAGEFIRLNPYLTAVIVVCSLLILGTGLASVMGPGEKAPPSTLEQIVEHGNWLFKEVSTKAVHYGTQAYAQTFPECKSWWARKMGQEPMCRMTINDEVQLIETFRYAFYMRMVGRMYNLWFYFGLILVEELIKRFALDGKPYGLIALCALEFTSKMMLNVGNFIPALIVVGLHIYLASLQYWKASFLHVVWNTTVFTMMIDPVFFASVDIRPVIYMYSLFQAAMPLMGVGACGAVFGPAYVAVPKAHTAIDANAFIHPASKWTGPKRQAFSQMGPLVPGCLPNVPASCSDNLYRAVRTRHLLPKEPLAFDNAETRRRLREALNVLPVPEGRTLNQRETAKFYRYRWVEWLEHYTPNQRSALEFGKRCVQMSGFRNAWAKCHRVFTKVEKLLKNGKDFAPRLVLTVTPQFSAVVGPYLYSLSKWFKVKLNRFSIIMYAPGQSVEAISSWTQMMRDMGMVLFKIDQSKCDSSYRRVILATTAEYYLRAFCPRRVYRAIVAAYKRCKIYGNDGLRAAVDGTLVTGSNETTIGNTGKLICVYIATAFAYMTPAEKAEFKEQLSRPYRRGDKRPLFGIIQAGDDAIMAVSPELMERGYHPNDARDYGFRPNASTGPLHTLEFLSGCFYPVDGTLKWGPKGGRQIPKMGADIDFEKQSIEKLRGVVLSMIRQANHVPVFGAYVRRLEELTRGHKATPLKRNDDEWNPKSAEMSTPSSDTYTFAAMRYGLTEIDLAACEHRISTMGLYDLLNDPVINRMIEVDTQ